MEVCVPLGNIELAGALSAGFVEADGSGGSDIKGICLT